VVRGVTQPVRWTECVEAMRTDGAGLFVEVGPGAVLSGLIRRIAPDAETIQVGDDDAARDLAARFAVAGGGSDGYGG